jgi:glucosamine-6-phosphate deaminase
MASTVEKKALERIGRKLKYLPEEKIGIISVDNFPELGRLTALRFLEWVQANPGGVISLPTGKTPEHFIKETRRFLDGWGSTSVRKELELAGIDPTVVPDMASLHFVQIDEFYPINPKQHNSFYNYVNRFYLEGFGLDPEKALLINCDEIGLPEGIDLEDLWEGERVDLSLRYRAARTERERVQQQTIHRIDQWATKYEDRIRELGGIGFFLGGIGPDGHIGFNVRGSDLNSTTRLTEINYETMAAAAGDLGGIEISRKSHVITIGLATITFNPKGVALIIAAGEAKAGIVRDAITSDRDVLYPASALQELPNARFYLTEGAAKYLLKRKHAGFVEQKEVAPEDIERIVVRLSLSTGKRILDLEKGDYQSDDFGKTLLAKTKAKPEDLNSQVASGLKAKIEAGITLAKNTRFLHTEPHHDDVMLGYLPHVVRHIREHTNSHHFVTFTSGFTAVTNGYMLRLCRRLKEALESGRYRFEYHMARGYFDPSNSKYRNRDVWKYLDGVAARSEEIKEEGTLRRFLRNLMEIFDDVDLANLADRVDELINYFETQYPGKKDLPHIQRLKGMAREWESACLWGYFGWHNDSVDHLRLGFYKGDIFTEEPTVNRDVLPVLDLLESVNPDVVSVAFDPEASGPDTHYKVLQAVSEALRMHREKNSKEVEVLGYRNVWYRFQPDEANVFVPVSLNMLTLQHESFMNTYITQKDASFPSYEFDGPFSLLAQKIQVEQYEMLKTCLGRDYFYDHPSALIRATRGFVFVRSMGLDEFFRHSRELRKRAENK